MSGNGNVFSQARIDDVGAITVSGTTALTWKPGQKVKVKRLIFVTTTALTVADSTVTVSVANADGTSSTNKGSFTLPFTGSAKNDVTYVDMAKPSNNSSVASDGSTVVTANPDLIEIDPGQELSVASDGGSTAGACEMYVEYYQSGFAPEVLSPTEATFTAA